MKNKTLTKIMVLLTALLLTAPAVIAQTIDYSKMDQDLSIMENVLKTILSKKEIEEYYEVSRIKGVYLEDYGVVIMTSAETRDFREEKAKRAKVVFDQVQDEIREFFLNYAGAVKQLSANDWITIVVNTTEDNEWRWTIDFSDEEKKETFKPYPFKISVKKSELDRARASNTAAKDLNVSVVRAMNGEDSGMQGNINIMKSILETAIEGGQGVDYSRSRFQGTYLPNFGVMFIVNSGSSYRIAMPARDIFFVPEVPEVPEIVSIVEGELATAAIIDIEVAELEEQIESSFEAAMVRLRADDEESQIKRQKEGKVRVNKLISILTEVVGDYGHTLRGLKPNEKVSVLYTTTSGYWGKSRGKFNIMLSAEFKDIQDYSRGRISLDAFKKKVKATSYD